MPVDQLAHDVAAGKLQMQIGRTFPMSEIVAAHRLMEENKAGGKVVVIP